MAAAEEEGCPSREGKMECGREEEECKKERRIKKVREWADERDTKESAGEKKMEVQ